MIDTVTTWPDGTKRSIKSTDKPFYKFGESTRQRLGGSAEFGQLYNLDTRKNGTHYAFALHYELTTKRVSLKAQLTTYAMNPKNGEEMTMS